MTLASLVDCIEAAYEVETTDEQWLAGLARSVAPLVDHGLGAGAYIYDVRDPGNLRMIAAHMPPVMEVQKLGAFFAGVPPEYIRKTWPKPFGLASATEGFHGPLSAALYAQFGARDVIAINGLDASGFGVWMGALTPEPVEMTAEHAALYERLSSHLATAIRLRRRLSRAPDAVLEPSGKIVDAQGDATLRDARVALSEAAARIEEARGPLRHGDPARAVGNWKGLVAARWSLVDRFERDGTRYIVARQNAHEAAESSELSPRERAVVAALSLGRHSKLIAYELGLADSTVRVLLFRAMRKLGAKSREEMVARFQAGHSS